MHNLSVKTLATGQGDLHGKSLTRATFHTYSKHLYAGILCLVRTFALKVGGVICVVNGLRGAALRTYSNCVCGSLPCIVGPVMEEASVVICM